MFGLAAETNDIEGGSADCGTIATYLYLALIGEEKSLEVIKGKLPAMPTNGYSFQELSVAMRECGVAVKGVKWNSGSVVIDEPILTLLEEGGHGHFVVMRPIGSFGRQLQVIDGLAAPYLIDKSTLSNSSKWSRLALCRVKPTRGLLVLAWCLVFTSVIVSVVLVRMKATAAGSMGTIRLPNLLKGVQ